MLEGSSIYDGEVSELISRLKAEGVLLIVVNGERNKSPIEFASAIQARIIPRVIEVLLLTAAEMQRDMDAVLAQARISKSE